MNGIKTTTAILLAIAAYTLFANPAPAEPLHSTSASVGCTGDYVCGDDVSVVATWPLERWDTVRRVRQLAAVKSAPTRLPPSAKQ
jgi:hypothetical protein